MFGNNAYRNEWFNSKFKKKSIKEAVIATFDERLCASLNSVADKFLAPAVLSYHAEIRPAHKLTQSEVWILCNYWFLLEYFVLCKIN